MALFDYNVAFYNTKQVHSTATSDAQGKYRFDTDAA